MLSQPCQSMPAITALINVQITYKRTHVKSSSVIVLPPATCEPFNPRRVWPVKRSAAILKPKNWLKCSFPTGTSRWQTHTHTVTRPHSRTLVILSSHSCRTKVSYYMEQKCVYVWRRCKQGTIFIFAFFVQFNSCTNLLSNYANEFTVGGSPSRPSGDLDSLENRRKVSLARVWQFERLQKGNKEREKANEVKRRLAQEWSENGNRFSTNGNDAKFLSFHRVAVSGEGGFNRAAASDSQHRLHRIPPSHH